MIKLKCIDNENCILTIGKIYDCSDITAYFYRIIDDRNVYGGFLKSRFVDITRGYKLKKLNL